MITITFRQLKIAGILLFLGAIQFTIATLVAGALYPGYSGSNNFISDLGVWGKASAAVFNPSIIISGVTIIISAFLINKAVKARLFPVLLALSGVGNLIVGFFSENTFLAGGLPIIHSFGAFMAFVFGATSAIYAYKVTKSPFKYLSVLLGLISLIAFAILLTTGNTGFLTVGPGTIERLIAYPTLFWIIGFAGYLLGAE